LEFLFITEEDRKLSAAPEMQDYDGVTPVVTRFRRMRSIRTPKNNLRPQKSLSVITKKSQYLFLNFLE
jgi:hypothetical protein